jgi:hypothetical protein
LFAEDAAFGDDGDVEGFGTPASTSTPSTRSFNAPTGVPKRLVSRVGSRATTASHARCIGATSAP